MTDDEYIHLNGRVAALETLMTTVMAFILGNNTADPIIGAQNARKDTLETMHLLGFPDDARGTLIRHEAAEALERAFDNIEARLRSVLG